MSAKHALLGLLQHRPGYPYELADRLRGRFGPAWDINSGHLYQTIGKLETDGLIRRIDVASTKRNRQVYEITQSGEEEFERWWDDTSDGELFRRSLLVKLTLAGPERMAAALKQIEAYEVSCASRLKELSRVQNAIPDHGAQVRADHVLLRLNLSADISQLEGELRWARHAYQMISWLLSREAIWPSAHERSGALGAEVRSRQAARDELFEKMAARHRLRSIVMEKDMPSDELPGDASGRGRVKLDSR